MYTISNSDFEDAKRYIAYFIEAQKGQRNGLRMLNQIRMAGNMLQRWEKKQPCPQEKVAAPCK